MGPPLAFTRQTPGAPVAALAGALAAFARLSVRLVVAGALGLLVPRGGLLLTAGVWLSPVAALVTLLLVTSGRGLAAAHRVRVR